MKWLASILLTMVSLVTLFAHRGDGRDRFSWLALLCGLALIGVVALMQPLGDLIQ